MLQLPMRAPGLTQALLKQAAQRSKRGRKKDSLGLGFGTRTASSVDPPAPAEFVEAVKRVEQASGNLLDGLVLFSVTCNQQPDADAPHVPHYDPKAYEAIVGVSLGPGRATMKLLEGDHVAYEQVLEPGTAW